MGPDSGIFVGITPAGPHFLLYSAPYNSRVGPECGSQNVSVCIHIEKQEHPETESVLGSLGWGSGESI